MLYPETDGTFLCIEDLIFRIGMVKGEAGKDEEIGQEKRCEKTRVEFLIG